jgi:capsular polysaccharide export protein
MTSLPRYKTFNRAQKETISVPAIGKRNFLFLQGMASLFFVNLGKALLLRGHGVYRINFNGGDRLFWSLPNAADFRGHPDEWRNYFHEQVSTRNVTDIILFGDCRALHRQAISIAQQLQIAVHVCEEGYIRPHWVTFERDGVNGHSQLSRNPDWFLDTSAQMPPLPPPQAMRSSFARRAWEDFIYNAAVGALWLRFPHYRTHRPRNRMVEYASWSRKVALRPWTSLRTRAQAALLTEQTRFFLLPLQLDGDSQIRQHSRFGGMRPAIAQIIESFAAAAPADTVLVVKEHPLDDGLVCWRKLVMRLAAAAGLGDRVVYLESGDLDWLVGHATGLVTVNSTTGTLALEKDIPVATLGLAIYDIAGLTHQGPLDTFWTAPSPPDRLLYQAFCRVLISRCLLPGSFFSQQGIKMLVDEAVCRLEADGPRHPAIRTAGVEALPSVPGSLPSALPAS